MYSFDGIGDSGKVRPQRKNKPVGISGAKACLSAPFQFPVKPAGDMVILEQAERAALLAIEHQLETGMTQTEGL